MSTYAPASSVGWLDFDSAASERAAALLRALEEPGTLDPIGLGVVRDAFSGILSPGTSTIQTRIRYFLFIPWICQRLESDRIAPREFAAKLRYREAQLIDCLRPLGPNRGIIGYSAGNKLKRLPSEVYWGGLRNWGLRRLDLSLAEYGQRAAALGRMKPERDDDHAAIARGISMWATTMPGPPEDFLKAEISFDLREEEALFLADFIRHRRPGSLLAALCDDPKRAELASYPWEVPADGFGDGLVQALHHARCFSELTVGPQHLYNALLAQKARKEFGWETDEVEAREMASLGRWADAVAQRGAELGGWVEDIATFWAFLEPFESVSPVTREFIEAIVEPAVQDPTGYHKNETVRATLEARELRLKGKRARLTNRAALESWNQAPFGGQLDYRWLVTKSYISDMATALEAQG